MKSIRNARRIGIGAFVFAAAAWMAPQALTAQDWDDDRSCVCVDRDGEEIQNCTCIRSPNLMMDGVNWTGFMRRAQIGVSIAYDQTAQAESRGARIEEVMDGSPAEAAGLRAGDIVTHVDGASVMDPLEDDEVEDTLSDEQSLAVQRFVRLVGALEPEEEVELRILRDGDARTLSITPEASDASFFVNGDMPGLAFFRGGPEGFELRSGELRDGMRLLEERLGEDGVRLRGLERGALEERMRAEGLTRERLAEIEERTAEDRQRMREQAVELQGRLHALREGEDGHVRVWSGDGDEGIVRLFGDGEFAFRGDPCMVRRDGEDGFAVIVNGRNCTDGVEFVDLNEGLGAYFGTSEGVLVTEVYEESALGLEAGDVLLAIDGREVEDRTEVQRILRSYELDDEIRLRVRRDDREVEILGRRRGEG